MKKKLRKKLSLIANELPEMRYKSIYYRIENVPHPSFPSIMTKGRIKEETTYPVNHLRRIKRAFLRGGLNSVKKYCDYVKDYFIKNEPFTLYQN